ncbi:MAG: hypothetical protein Q8R83_02745, partial [Legionellaceae bacterium]|nr:hypothetical protein [Legionellaceae bacterium]
MSQIYKLFEKHAEAKDYYLQFIKSMLFIRSSILRCHYQNLPTMLLLYISAIVICLTWHAGIKLGLDANQVSFRYYLYAIPIALSRILGNVNDYTPFNELGALFNHSAGDLNTLIKHALTIKPLSNAKPLYFISGDDKGLADITSLAFSIFGLKQQSLYHNFFFILSSSALIFALQFYKSFEKCLVLFVILISLYVCIYTFS